jgi:hypothetical protein
MIGELYRGGIRLLGLRLLDCSQSRSRYALKSVRRGIDEELEAD